MMEKQKWISAKEQLPEDSGEYIVFIKDPFFRKGDNSDIISVDCSYVTSAHYNNLSGLWCESETSFYCANLSCVNTKETFHITHWMPLPEVPKE